MMVPMNDATSTTAPAAGLRAVTSPRTTTAGDIAPEQLTLLPEPNVPARFRLSRDTRVRGLRHVAEIRAMLAARRVDDDTARALPPRRDRAA